MKILNHTYSDTFVKLVFDDYNYNKLDTELIRTKIENINDFSEILTYLELLKRDIDNFYNLSEDKMLNYDDSGTSIENFNLIYGFNRRLSKNEFLKFNEFLVNIIKDCEHINIDYKYLEKIESDTEKQESKKTSQYSYVTSILETYVGLVLQKTEKAKYVEVLEELVNLKIKEWIMKNKLDYECKVQFFGDLKKYVCMNIIMTDLQKFINENIEFWKNQIIIQKTNKNTMIDYSQDSISFEIKEYLDFQKELSKPEINTSEKILMLEDYIKDKKQTKEAFPDLGYYCNKTIKLASLDLDYYKKVKESKKDKYKNNNKNTFEKIKWLGTIEQLQKLLYLLQDLDFIRINLEDKSETLIYISNFIDTKNSEFTTVKQQNIIWYGKQTELAYLIGKLKDENNLISEEQIWKKAKSIFIKKDGSKYKSLATSYQKANPISKDDILRIIRQVANLKN